MRQTSSSFLYEMNPLFFLEIHSYLQKPDVYILKSLYDSDLIGKYNRYWEAATLEIRELDKKINTAIESNNRELADKLSKEKSELENKFVGNQPKSNVRKTFDEIYKEMPRKTNKKLVKYRLERMVSRNIAVKENNSHMLTVWAHQTMIPYFQQLKYVLYELNQPEKWKEWIEPLEVLP